MNSFSRIFLTTILISLLATFSMKAQSGFALRFQSLQMGANYWQPALLAKQQSQGGLQIGFDGDYSLGTNNLPYNLLQFTDTYLEQGEKDRILSELGTNNQLRAAVMAGGQIQFSLGNIPLSLSYRLQQNTFLQVPSTQSLALVLNGNRPYAGSIIEDKDLRFQNLQWAEYGIGSAYTFGKLDVGLRLKLLQGRMFNQLTRLDYTFFTEADGTSIDVSADYEAISSVPNTLQPGIGIDIGLLYNFNEKISLGLSANNIGGISWQASHFENAVNFSYTGIDVSNIFSFNLSDINEFFVLDTVQALFVPDSTQGRFMRGVGGNVQASFSYTIDQESFAWAMVQYGLNPFADGRKVPFVVIGYQRRVIPSLMLGTHFYGGGLDQYGWGLFGEYQIGWGKDNGLALFIALDNSLGSILPTVARGIRLNGGISLHL